VEREGFAERGARGGFAERGARGGFAERVAHPSRAAGRAACIEESVHVDSMM
jgi:hypothetical protein